MSKHFIWAGALAVLALAAPIEAAQAQSSFQVTPYAGYLKSGTLLNGPAGTALRSPAAPVYGGELALGLVPGLSLVGNVAYSKPELEVGAPIVGGLAVGESSILLYDAAVRLKLPVPVLPFSPFLQAGAGEIRHTFAVGPVETRATSFAYNVGGGVDIRVAPGVGLQLMAKDYISKFDAREVTAVDVETKTTHNWALSAGLRLGM